MCKFCKTNLFKKYNTPVCNRTFSIRYLIKQNVLWCVTCRVYAFCSGYFHTKSIKYLTMLILLFLRSLHDFVTITPIAWLLITWLLAPPSHQQSWYWLQRIVVGIISFRQFGAKPSPMLKDESENLEQTPMTFESKYEHFRKYVWKYGLQNGDHWLTHCDLKMPYGDIDLFNISSGND